jgi:hypothetical protein
MSSNAEIFFNHSWCQLGLWWQLDWWARFMCESICNSCIKSSSCPLYWALHPHQLYLCLVGYTQKTLEPNIFQFSRLSTFGYRFTYSCPYFLSLLRDKNFNYSFSIPFLSFPHIWTPMEPLDSKSVFQVWIDLIPIHLLSPLQQCLLS